MGVSISHPDFEMEEDWPMRATFKEYQLQHGVHVDHVIFRPPHESDVNSEEKDSFPEQSPMLKAFLGEPLENITNHSAPDLRGLPFVPTDYAYQLAQVTCLL